MLELPAPVVELINLLSKLPGVGRRSANRLAFRLLDMDISELDKLKGAVLSARENTMTCETCGCLSDSSPCRVCSDPARDDGLICVVSGARDVFAMESVQGSFNGKYHVLGGVLSPVNKIGPDALNIAPLLNRVQSGVVREVILATNSDVEGEATASYIAQLIKPMGVRTTRIAHGIPLGGHLEYTDPMTLGIAIEGRREF